MFIENRLRECRAFVDQQLNDVTQMLQHDRLHGVPGSPSAPAKMHQVLSAVPPTGDSQEPTLLFTSETQHTFLRSALSRELFQRLKKVAKRWLANVPAEKRNQATKIAQMVAQAVVDGRVNNITHNDLETYRTRIQQSFGHQYVIPTEELAKAISRKIRVYLQNTKSKHKEWVERYGGIDINAPMVDIDSNSPVASPKKETTGVKREILEGEYDSPSPKRPKVEPVEVILPADMYSHLLSQQYGLVDPPPPTISAGERMDYYQKNIIIFYEQSKSTGFPPELLLGCYPLVLGFCLHHRILDVSLQELPLFLQKTGLRLLAVLAQAGGTGQFALFSVHSIIQHNRGQAIDTQKQLAETEMPLINLVHRITMGEEGYSTPHNLLSTFIDYAWYHRMLTNEEFRDCQRIMNSPENLYAAHFLAKLNITDFPEDLAQCHHPLLPTVVLLMYCALCKAEAPNYTNDERFLHMVYAKVANVVLSDMFGYDTTLRDSIPPPTAAALDVWSTN